MLCLEIVFYLHIHMRQQIALFISIPDDNPDNDKAIVEFTDDKPTIETSTRRRSPKEIKFYAQKDEDNLEENIKM